MSSGRQLIYQGDPVAAVAADTEERARDAARLIRVRYDVLPHFANVEQAMATDAPLVSPRRQHQAGRHRRRPATSTPASTGRAHRRGDLLDARDRPRLPRDARHGLRVGRRQADRLDLDAGGESERAGIRAGLGIPQANVQRHHPVHGRRFRQQVRARRAGHHLRRSSPRIAKLPVKLMLDRKEEHLDTGNRPSATAHIRAGVTADGMLTAFDGAELGHRRRRRAERTSRCRTSTTFRTASARTRTSSSTPASSARCARRDIRRAAS